MKRKKKKKNQQTATAKCNKSQTTCRRKTCKRTVCALIKFCAVPIKDVKKKTLYTCLHLFLCPHLAFSLSHSRSLALFLFQF